MSRVDVLADDRGLQGCFKVANIQQEWAQDFITKHKLVTLDDYIYSVANDTWEKGVETLVSQVPTLRDNMIALARFRSAFDIGREALRQAAAPATKSADLDEPLPEATMKSLNQDWARRYNLQLDPSLEPCEALRSRLYREFRKGQLTVIEARKVKSVITVAQPKTQGSVTLGDNLHLEFEKEEGIPIKSCVEYYLQMRVLAHALAWAGNYQVDYEGGRHWMMDLSTVLGYVDVALRSSIEFAGGSMLWLQRNDVLTRGKLATYVNRGMPGSVAMKQALHETHFEWRSPLAAPLVVSSGSGSPGTTKRKQESSPLPVGEAPTKRPRTLKADRWATVSMIKGGKRLCKPYNDGRGCSNSQCDQMHACDVKLPNGKPCLCATPGDPCLEIAAALPATPVGRVVSLRDPLVDPLQRPVDRASADRLRAAKPVAWRGLGDLPQFAWAKPLVGSWLVIDLWAGFSGLCVALLAMGVRFHAVAAENDIFPAQVAEQIMPQVVTVDAVETVTGTMFRPFLQRRQVRGIILGAARPPRMCDPGDCHVFGKRGLYAPRSHGPVYSMDGLPTYPHRCGRLRMGATGACGWVQRPRLLWLGQGRCGVSPRCTPPTAGYGSSLGPIPPSCAGRDPSQSLFDAAEVVKAAGQGAMHPFTREFWHPCDRVKLVPPEAAARFYQDERRFPPLAYTAESLLWRKDEWRQPGPEERAQMMGFPAQCLQAVQGPAAVRRQRQNSMLGNGFHLPMIVALFCLLPGVLSMQVPRPLFDLAERKMQERLAGTVWEPGRLQVFPGLLSSDQVVQSMQRTVFGSLPISANVWQLTATRLAPLPVWQLQAYTAWAVGRGLTGQRYPGNSRKGLDHLRKEEHIKQAVGLPSPFRLREWPEQDVDFVLHAIATWQQALIGYSEQCRQVFRQVCTALLPLDDELRKFRVHSAVKVAAGKRPAVLAFLTVILRWPDLQQPLQMLQGYPIVGALEPSGVFRSITAREALPKEEWLGDAAVAAVERIESSRPPRFAERIYAATVLEQQKQFCSPFLTKRCMDERFGVGQWRPLQRFLIVQPDGKERVIDNARKTLHNSSTAMMETIYTVHLDFIPAVIKQLAHRLQVTSPGDWSVFHPWAHFRLGTDDLPDAYRGLPVCPEHLPYSAVAVWVPQQGWRYTILWGLAFGLESAVVSFNRLPQLGIAATRRCLYGLAAAYFDDELAVEVVAAADISQQALRLLFTSIGAPPQKAKGFAPSPDRHYLGAAIHLGSVMTTGCVRIQPKFATVAKVAGRLRVAIANRCLTKEEAGKLRGDITWMFSLAAGHMGRIAQPVLAKCSSDGPTPMDDEDVVTLQVLLRIVLDCQPRDVQVCGMDKVPPEVIDSWVPRRQQIYPGEAIVALVIPALLPDLLRGQDLLWFVDNESATSTLIRCVSSQCDVHEIAQFSHYLLNSLDARAWFEWIDSESNPSDGLSRLGLADEWTQAQGDEEKLQALVACSLQFLQSMSDWD
ncbi:unnamed protein product [Cladocopium goreaui]|uniref:Uncharacterized protein n=1 Tax=Cladocopium goreaui TaxID=2562237 RepID=A0A9P1BN30_9DINO|nr:unnamed protein product [Cladocopium goreaui]